MSKASKNDKIDNKPDYSLIPKVFVDQVAYVMMAGAQKYGRFNYTQGHDMSQLISAAERHLKQLQDGEDIDRDTTERVGVDIEHAACVCANMLMLLHQKQLGTLNDDRFKKAEKNPGVAPLSPKVREKLFPQAVDDKVVVECYVEWPASGGATASFKEIRHMTRDEANKFIAENPGSRILSTVSGSYFMGGKL